MVPVCLSIGGSDPSGGAGIQADLKTFQKHGVYGAAAISLLTIQDTTGVKGVRVLEPEFLLAQIGPVLSDLPVAAVKTGALGSAANASAIVRGLDGWNGFLVVDPVLAATSGGRLTEAGLFEEAAPLFSRADLVTPNLEEAGAFLGRPIESEEAMRHAAERMRNRLGCGALLLKGGHLGGSASPDLLVDASGFCRYDSPRVGSNGAHGTGCALASAIAALRARERPLRTAVAEAKDWLTSALRRAPGLGKGIGPLDFL
jgi:hydroxymethylpyrimidine/phosphomethylpyrimidine kinase